ncbi:MAG TPA: hypothetical protein PK239_06200 [Chitinophagales bacterium]|nr:hypothetical protein [Chitinophagales bacterium]HRK26866.1 hypothetical protein [Chitinophagales bacterium]
MALHTTTYSTLNYCLPVLLLQVQVPAGSKTQKAEPICANSRFFYFIISIYQL